jgi:kinetochore protein Mis13/DSN1
MPLPLPDESVLDLTEARMLQSLTSKACSFQALKAQTETRLKSLQESLEFRVDMLFDGVHKLEQRVATAGREADRVLALSASRLKERDEREKLAAGTGELPVMEVVRSLGRVLPESE